MKARLPKGYGRPDPNAMMRQVQKMQDDIRAKQEELEAKEYTGTASGEMVLRNKFFNSSWFSAP